MRRDIPELPKQFYQLDNYFGIRAWCCDAVIVAASVLLAIRWPFLYPLAVLAIGARQRALATLLHESAHRTLAKSRPLNDFLGTWLCACAIFQTRSAYRASHITGHHGHFGGADDPDLAFHEEIGLYGRVTASVVWLGLARYLRYLVVNRLLPQQSASRFELLQMAALWIALLAAFGVTNVIVFWIVPLLVAFGPIGYLIEIAEHWPLMPSASALYRTRNRASCAVEAFFFSIHAEDRHLVHHLYPRLPLRSMKQADRYLCATWPEYRAWNEANGGIIVSANGAPSLLRLLAGAIGKGGAQ